MISNQILQDTVTGIKSITRVELCVMDTEGKILATTMRGMEEYEDEVVKFSESAADSQVIVASSFLRCMMRMNWDMSYWQKGMPRMSI